MDVTAVVTYLSGTVTTAITSIGVAVLIIAVTIAGYRLVKRMIR